MPVSISIFIAGLGELTTAQLIYRISRSRSLGAPSTYQTDKLNAYKGELKSRDEVAPICSQVNDSHHHGVLSDD